MKTPIERNYSQGYCDLCGSQKLKVILEKLLPYSILSDNKTVPIGLRKIECESCGLIRDGHDINAEYLSRLYQFDYTLNIRPEEYHFLTRQGAIPRSKLFFDWIWDALESNHLINLEKVVEIGCGAGHLLMRMQAALPQAQFWGTEMSEGARSLATSSGCRVIAGGIEQLSETNIDLIYSVGVLEHVPRPGDFIKAIRDHLSPSGMLVLIQPTQDVPSSDIYFSDHLHHFGTDHLDMYAEKIGFTKLIKTVGHPLMPNFSFHMWQPAEPSKDYVRWGQTRCHESITYHEAMFEHVNDLVDELQSNKTRKFAVFGLNERYALLRAYSCLSDLEIVCGLSDVEPGVPVDFPVVKPESVREFPITDVIVCVNQIHQEFVRERLAPLGFTVHVM
jgi:SAM-dependent methyltransferase